MPPKGKKSAADRPKEVDKAEEPLRAVVLADSFEKRFYPFTAEQPRCLLPLANTPLIEYTFQFLANSGVEEVYVYCGAHTDQIEDYIASSKWSSTASTTLSYPFTKLEVIRSTSKSIGDAMRDLDARSLMTGDFIIVYGDVVSNMPLAPALAEHRARRAKDKNSIMTMVLREAGVAHRTKAQRNSPVFVLDPAKQRCLHYEQMLSRRSDRYAELDPEILASCDEVEVRHDLIDCGIDICTPDVLALWSDNFDYEAPRRGFLHSVLKDYELNGKTIHTHIAKDQYAARVRNLHAYDSVSRDIVAGFAHPVRPDANLLEGQTYHFNKRNVYEEKGVHKAWSCKIGPRSVIGSGTRIGKDTTIRNSVIGRNCRIADNCIIEGAYLWDRAVVGEGSEIRGAVVACDAVIGEACKIVDGALISYGVKITDGVVVSKRRRVMKQGKQVKATPDVKIVGTDGLGHEYVPSDSEDDDTKAGLTGSIYHHPTLAVSNDSISTLDSDLSEEEPVHHSRSAAGSFVSITSDDGHVGPHPNTTFYREAVLLVYEGLKEKTEALTINLELQSLRMTIESSQDTTTQSESTKEDALQDEARHAVVVALVRYTSEVGQAASVLLRYKELVRRTIFDRRESKKPNQVAFLVLVQKELAAKAGVKALEGVMLQVLNVLFAQDEPEVEDEEVIQREGIEQWWGHEESLVGDSMVAVRGQVEKFMEAMLAPESSEEETDSGEDDEDDEEEEDDDEDDD